MAHSARDCCSTSSTTGTPSLDTPLSSTQVHHSEYKLQKGITLFKDEAGNTILVAQRADFINKEC